MKKETDKELEFFMKNVAWLRKKNGLTKKKTDVLGAIILKWLKDGLIRIEQKETGMIFKNVIIRIISLFELKNNTYQH